MFPLQLAADEMSALPGAGFLKTILFYACVVGGLLYMFAPTVWAKLKASIVSSIEEKTNVQLPFLHSQPATYNASTYAPPGSLSSQSAGQIAQQRAAELRAVCAKAPPALRLKWLEAGTAPDKAQSEYIAMLEDQLSANPALPPAPTNVSSVTTA